MASASGAAQFNEPSPGGLSEAEVTRYTAAEKGRSQAVQKANSDLEQLAEKRTSGIQWDESFFNGDEGMLPVPTGEQPNEWFIIDPEGFENYDNLRVQIFKYDDGHHARWDTSKTDGIIGDYSSLAAGKQASEAYFRDKAGEELSGTFGADLDSQQAIRGIFDHFAVPDGVEFDGWGSTKWGSWYAHARGYDIKRGEVRTLKLSVRDHDATRKDLRLPDLTAEVSKNWRPEEVAGALKRLEERLWKRLGAVENTGVNPESSRAAGGTNPGPNGETFSASRAIPADASKVVQMPDGARLVGPTTFSIRAFHGTPHKVDKFTTAKIGTGHGPQLAVDHEHLRPPHVPVKSTSSHTSTAQCLLLARHGGVQPITTGGPRLSWLRSRIERS